jgi:hypothetical protein
MLFSVPCFSFFAHVYLCSSSLKYMPPSRGRLVSFQPQLLCSCIGLSRVWWSGKAAPILCSKVCILLVPCRQHETVIPGELPLVQELTNTLREWAVIWRKLYVVSFSWSSSDGGLGCHFWTLSLIDCWDAEPSSALS